MTLTDLYALTGEEFEISDFRPAQAGPGIWTITAARQHPKSSAATEDIVGHGVTEEAALRDLRLQWVVNKYGDYRG